MEDIRYHPLVDTEETVKTPMFFTTDADTVINHHRLYLEEIVPYRFRLCSSAPIAAGDTTGFAIRCPYCGKDLKQISQSRDGYRHSLFLCDCGN